MYTGDAAYEVEVQGVRVKMRDPWRVGILVLVTLGIYGIVWFYKANRELDDYAHETGAHRVGGNPALAVLGITLGVVLVIVPFATWIWFLIRLSRAQEHRGIEGTITPWYSAAMWLLAIFPIAGTVVFYEWVQLNLNIIWEGRSIGTRAPVSLAAPRAARGLA